MSALFPAGTLRRDRGNVVSMTEAKRLHVITWGCQMNVYDSGRMADVLAPLGYAPTATPDDADMVILNTCHIRDRAAEKVFSELGRLRLVKEARASAGERMDPGGRRLRRPGRGRGRSWPAPPSSTSCWVPRPTTGCRNWWPAPARACRRHVIDTDFPAEAKFDHLPDAAATAGPGPRS